ncbi:MAG TPA: N-acetyl-alpha-D-glucosaminyl L-malate synthase BshA [Candidatus Hydrogenedentes bacterium]|nr:N-acetyl-alpha-D-glucosaminyl L-malate synthase BshA [Candidatus Hydrogenedentota bacterium]
MKIGITCLASAGGSGILATELGLALANRGHEIHFVSYEPLFRVGCYDERITCHYLELTAYPQFRHSPHTLALATKIADVTDEHGIQLWHAHYAIPFAVCALQARGMVAADKRFKIVTTLHGTDITLVGIDPSFYRITRFAMEASDAVTTVSRWLADETRREFGLSRPIQTIYNFFNEERFQTDRLDRKKLAAPDEKILMHISNFRPVKRVTDVVRVFKKVLERVPARLVMVGDGPERTAAVGVARQLDVADKVKFLGSFQNVESILPLADLVIQPSEHESFGLVPLEAMVAGVPVIATASGGVCEVIEHGETGYLCEVGDIDSMAQYAAMLLTVDVLARDMGRKGRERSQQRFAREPIVSQYEKLYASLLHSADWTI